MLELCFRGIHPLLSARSSLGCASACALSQQYDPAATAAQPRGTTHTRRYRKLLALLALLLAIAPTRAQILATLTGHAGSITDLAYSPDGTHFISSSEDQTIKIWNAATHETVATLIGHTGIVYSVAYSPNGKLIISGGWDGAINIWNARNYQLIQTLRGNAGTVTSVSTHPGGDFIMSGHSDGSINIWNTSAYQLSKTLNGHSGTVEAYVQENMAAADDTMIPPTFWTSTGNDDRIFSEVPH